MDANPGVWIVDRTGRWTRDAEDCGGRLWSFEVTPAEPYGADVVVFVEGISPPYHMNETRDTRHALPWYPTVREAMDYCDRRFRTLVRRQSRPGVR